MRESKNSSVLLWIFGKSKIYVVIFPYHWTFHYIYYKSHIHLSQLELCFLDKEELISSFAFKSELSYYIFFFWPNIYVITFFWIMTYPIINKSKISLFCLTKRIGKQTNKMSHLKSSVIFLHSSIAFCSLWCFYDENNIRIYALQPPLSLIFIFVTFIQVNRPNRQATIYTYGYIFIFYRSLWFVYCCKKRTLRRYSDSYCWPQLRWKLFISTSYLNYFFIIRDNTVLFCTILCVFLLIKKKNKN